MLFSFRGSTGYGVASSGDVELLIAPCGAQKRRCLKHVHSACPRLLAFACARAFACSSRTLSPPPSPPSPLTFSSAHWPGHGGGLGKSCRTAPRRPWRLCDRAADEAARVTSARQW